jgi:hypothetical protein
MWKSVGSCPSVNGALPSATLPARAVRYGVPVEECCQRLLSTRSLIDI